MADTCRIVDVQGAETTADSAHSNRKPVARVCFDQITLEPKSVTVLRLTDNEITTMQKLFNQKPTPAAQWKPEYNPVDAVTGEPTPPMIPPLTAAETWRILDVPAPQGWVAPSALGKLPAKQEPEHRFRSGTDPQLVNPHIDIFSPERKAPSTQDKKSDFAVKK